jgi:hypothetical protein
MADIINLSAFRSRAATRPMSEEQLDFLIALFDHPDMAVADAAWELFIRLPFRRRCEEEAAG